MKTIAFLTLLLGGTAFAAPDGVPQKAPARAYDHLFLNSPFTSDPPPIGRPPVESLFEDWALGGVSGIEGGYMVTLVHKKNPGETRVIKPRGTVHSVKDEMTWLNSDDPKAFKVQKVTYGKSDWKDTTVQISSGDQTGTLKFDDKQFIPATSVQNRQGGQSGQQPGTTQAGDNNGRPPRPRVMPSAPPIQQTEGPGGRRNR